MDRRLLRFAVTGRFSRPEVRRSQTRPRAVVRAAFEGFAYGSVFVFGLWLLIATLAPFGLAHIAIVILHFPGWLLGYRYGEESFFLFWATYSALFAIFRYARVRPLASADTPAPPSASESDKHTDRK